MKAFFALLILSLLAGCAHRPEASPVTTVPYVDLKRYMGDWFVIANIPYFLEENKVASYDTYRMREDGRIDNIFTFRKGSLEAPERSWEGIATVMNTQTNAEWEVKFAWPLKATYLVIDLDPGYRWAVVGTPDRKLLWVLSRERHLDPNTYARILRRIENKGYSASQLVMVPQPD